MNVWRRPATWRLAATLVVVLLLAVPGAFAQSQRLRVKIGPANVYERPRTSSDVLMVAPEGAILDVLGREETWYWVLLPGDGNGQRRGAYIAIYLVELLSPKGPDVVPRTGGPALAVKPPAAKPAGDNAGPRTTRYFGGVGGGGQSVSPAFFDYVSYIQYDEPANFNSHYGVPRTSAVDATLGIRLSRRFVLAAAFWHSSASSSANVTAEIPSWLAYGILRPASTTRLVNRTENDGHMQMTWLMPVSPHVDLSIFGGPSLFYVRQELVSAPLTLQESYPFDTVGIAANTTVSKSRAAIGLNAGADVTVMVWRYFGVGFSGRYTRAWTSMASADTGAIDMRVGGVQMSGALRLRF
jgi:hypothetical protein